MALYMIVTASVSVLVGLVDFITAAPVMPMSAAGFFSCPSRVRNRELQPHNPADPLNFDSPRMFWVCEDTAVGAARALGGADGSALPATPPRAIGTRRGYMARVSQAPGFILTAPAAVAPRAAMAVRTAVA
jgi:hypothetical protein